MTVILLLLGLFCCSNLAFAKEGEFFANYLEKAKTNSIKGIFVALVFIAHYLSYIKEPSVADSFAVWQHSALSQLIVTMFLFYSGYGIFEAIKRKGNVYTKAIPQKAAKLLFHFDIAVVLFLCLAVFMKSNITVKKFLLSLICWESIGNSNWYVLAIIATYLFSFVAFSVCKKRYTIGAIVVTLLSIVYILVLRNWRPGYWYNTILCYSLGVWYSLYRDKIERIIMKNDLSYFFVLLVVIFYGVFYSKHGVNVWYYSGWSILFTMMIVLVSLKLQFDNNFLQFLGNHVFSIYILQQLPMNLLSHYGKIATHPYLCFVIAFICTIFIALVFDKYTAKIDQKIFRKIN